MDGESSIKQPNLPGKKLHADSVRKKVQTPTDVSNLVLHAFEPQSY